MHRRVTQFLAQESSSVLCRDDSSKQDQNWQLGTSSKSLGKQASRCVWKQAEADVDQEISRMPVKPNTFTHEDSSKRNSTIWQKQPGRKYEELQDRNAFAKLDSEAVQLFAEEHARSSDSCWQRKESHCQHATVLKWRPRLPILQRCSTILELRLRT